MYPPYHVLLGGGYLGTPSVAYIHPTPPAAAGDSPTERQKTQCRKTEHRMTKRRKTQHRGTQCRIGHNLKYEPTSKDKMSKILDVEWYSTSKD